ncbi:hypothetical protein SpAn4DRAFT_1882 [Sporomusa ovata]|uniref:Uncharacterized protein n=1 Tax=Sporomusa ovata TaxID=2378 RepID=A0A0U1KW36_9FIRM|nr:hypothetical protein SpAn4DRAFT_1882 [Sporomusa ovata]
MHTDLPSKNTIMTKLHSYFKKPFRYFAKSYNYTGISKLCPQILKMYNKGYG